MFFLDDILLAPLKGLAAVCRKVHEAAEEDLDQQEKQILASLAELHHLMDDGRIGDDEFNVRECILLDRLDSCRGADGEDGADAEPDEEKGDSPHLPERPGGCCAQMGTVPFFPEEAQDHEDGN